ncbi:MAG: hypothetical protein ACLVKO_11895 [Dysgonomonas sp.]
MKNILSITQPLLDLLKVEAARLLGVNTDQIFVEYKQQVFRYDKYSVDFKESNSVAYLLGISCFGADSAEPEGYDLGLYIYHPDFRLGPPLIYFSTDYHEQNNINLFCNGFGFEGLGLETEFVVTYLRFSRK